MSELLTVWEKVQNACFQLNHDAYVLQASKGPVRRFYPCEKSLVLLKCLREDTHFGTAMAIANRTQCACHSELTESGLLAMCFDDTARMKHYAGPSGNGGRRTESTTILRVSIS